MAVDSPENADVPCGEGAVVTGLRNEGIEATGVDIFLDPENRIRIS